MNVTVITCFIFGEQVTFLVKGHHSQEMTEKWLFHHLKSRDEWAHLNDNDETLSRICETVQMEWDHVHNFSEE